MIDRWEEVSKLTRVPGVRRLLAAEQNAGTAECVCEELSSRSRHVWVTIQEDGGGIVECWEL